MECENCKRKNLLIWELITKLAMARMDVDADLINKATEEADKPPQRHHHRN